MECFNCHSPQVTVERGPQDQTITRCLNCGSTFIKNSDAVNKIIEARNLLTNRFQNNNVNTMAKIRHAAVKTAEDYQKNSLEKIQEKQKVVSLVQHPRRGPKTTAYKRNRIYFRLDDKNFKALKKKCAQIGESNPNLGARKLLINLIFEDQVPHGNSKYDTTQE